MLRITLVLLLGLTLSCKTGLSQKSTGEVIDVAAFETKIAELTESGKDFQLIDLRTRDELIQTGKIDGAINLDFYAEDFQSQLSGLDKAQPTLIYCRSGGRSGKTRSILLDMGFKEVYDLNGGMNQWKADGKITIAP